MAAGLLLFHKLRSTLWLLPAIALLPLGGCNGSGFVTIGGTVTYDGQPVEKGAIVFLSSDSKGPTAAALIANGKYTVKVALGRKQVRIEGHKIVGRQPCLRNDPASPMIDVTEPTVPAEYGENSRLTAEIRRGMSVLDFDLKAVAR
jgi:hypothetical protein